jgi:hypothetical protein
VSSQDGLAQHFPAYDGDEPLQVSQGPIGDDGQIVPVVLEARDGNVVWVRRLEDGEVTPPEPIIIEKGDILVPFTPIHSTSVNTTPTVGDATGFVLGIPVLEVRRDDEAKVVFVRTRRVAEPMPTSRVRVPYGYQFTIDAGDLVVELEWIDQMFPPGDDGYAPITNTIWTWMTIGPVAGAETLTRYLLSASRRLDAAHRSFTRIRNGIDALDPSGPGPHTRLAVFEIVGDIETTVVALSRAIDMAVSVGTLATITTPVPTSLTSIRPTITAIRNAYEHIEDRAKGRAHGSFTAEEALTIFDWTSLFEEDAISYAGMRLELSDLPGLLLDTRAFLKVAANEGKEALAIAAAAT